MGSGSALEVLRDDALYKYTFILLYLLTILLLTCTVQALHNSALVSATQSPAVPD